MSDMNVAKSNLVIASLCEEFKKNNHIPQEAYSRLNVCRGLRNADGTGVLAGLTQIGNVRGYSMVDNERQPMEGQLFYRGINVEDLVRGVVEDDRFGFEEVAYLILFGQLPTKNQLAVFQDLLHENRELPKNFTEDMIIKAPSSDIMNKLARSVLVMYSYDTDPDNCSLENMLRQSIALIAQMPIIAAQAYQVKRHYFENKSMYLHIPPAGLSTAETLLYCIRKDKKYTEEEAKLLDLCLILHAEHGGGNNSAFSCRVLSSSGTDTYSAIGAALGSLKGPLHGGANLRVCNMFADIERNVKNWKDDEEVANYLRRIIRREVGDQSGKIYGMGHAIYTMSDPRAVLLKDYARALAKKTGFIDRFELIESVERLTPQVFLEEKGNTKPLCANVDMYSGLIYEMLNIPKDLYTPIFAIARMVGWCAHRIEEATLGGRIIRPAYKSLAAAESYIPLADRTE
ncbi:MAG: citrate/2-methylcitrate synthase [Ruminococcaceae bacterium]|nr:citrate/2-methylcitrate synthase [Oscillospiraceae bacterium]